MNNAIASNSEFPLYGEVYFRLAFDFADDSAIQRTSSKVSAALPSVA